MTSPRVESKKQVLYTQNLVAPQRVAGKNSAPLLSFSNDNSVGLKADSNSQPTRNQTEQLQEIYLQSGRKIVIQKLSDGRSIRKYFSADGTQLKPNYFKKIEGEVKISADGKFYTVIRNGATKTFNTKNPTEAKISQQQAELNKAKKEQGFIGRSWDWFKNKTGIGDSSNKAQKQLDAEKNLLKQIQNGKVSKSNFKEITGLDCTQENIQKFKNGKTWIQEAIATLLS